MDFELYSHFNIHYYDLNTTVYKAVACSDIWQIIAALYMDFFTVMHSFLAEKLQKSTSIVK